MVGRKRPLGVLFGILGGLFLLVQGGDASASTPCFPSADSGLAVTRFSWSLDPRTQAGRVEVVLTNRGRRAVQVPPVAVWAYDVKGEELNRVWGRIKVSSLRPGASGILVLAMRLSRVPGGVRVAILEERGGT